MKEFIDYAKGLNASDKVISWIERILSKQEVIETSEAEHVIDYFINSRTKKDIEGMSYVDAVKNADKWSKGLQKKAKDIKEKKKDVQVVLDFKDGFKFVRLIGENAYKREGLLMRHCVSSYYGNSKEIYSLRDKNNMPHCTIEKDQQIKGKGNGKINPKYIRYVVEFLEYLGMEVRDSEMRNLGYVDVSEIIEKFNNVSFPNLFRDKYFYRNDLHKVKDRNNIEFWKVFDLFKIDSTGKVINNFDIEECVKNFKNSMHKASCDDGANQVSGNYAKQVGGNFAQQVGGDYAKQVVGDYAKQVGGEYAKQVGGEYAKQVGGNEANHVANFAAKQVGGSKAKQVGGDDAKQVGGVEAQQVGGVYAKQVGGDKAKQVGGDNSQQVGGDGSQQVGGDGSQQVGDDSSQQIGGNYAKQVGGDYSMQLAGFNSTQEVGRCGIAVSSNRSKVKGKFGSCLILIDRRLDFIISDVVVKIVDGKEVKEDVFYTLKNGKFVEA